MEQKFDAALPYERREKLRTSRRRQWCQPFLKFPSAREHFRLLPTRAEDESRGLPRPFPTLCTHVTYPGRKGSWECATREYSDPGQMAGGCLAQVVVTHYARKKNPTSIGGVTPRPGRGTWSAGSPANLEQRTGVECRQPRPTARGRGKRVSRGPVNPRRSSTHTWKAPGF
ncbi:hypothetical protein Bbelb_342160 [Branchiostoma belcheri]|nr:hypothetical protein Bbelb_342160 [Branchiostoma belcheri]